MAGFDEGVKPQDRTKARAFTYVAVAAGLAFLYAGLRDSTWVSSTAFHTLLEAVATLLALMVGILGLVRYRVAGQSTVFHVGMAFLGAGFLDGYHAVVTSVAFKAYLPSGLPALIPWSWVASRAFLSVMMWLSWMAWRREERLGPAGRIPEVLIYGFVALMTLVSFIFFAFMPLPQAYYPELFFHRPEEFVPALFFLLALVGYLRKGQWRHDALDHWLVMSLIVGFLGQAMFMSFSGRLFDTMFDAAHSLKVVSYICVMAGLFTVMASSRPEAERPTEPEGEGSTEGLSIGRLKALAYGVSSLLGVVMIGAIILGVRTVDDFNRVQEEWRFYVEYAEKRGLLLSRIRGGMGYGGFIHDFKNYVLRQEGPLYKKIVADLATVDKALHDYRETFAGPQYDNNHEGHQGHEIQSINLGEEESRALQALEEVVGQYRSKLAVARKSVALGRTPNQTDQLVAVDDRPALEAIAVLERLWNEERIRGAITDVITDGRNSVRQGMLFLPALLITLVLLLWLLRGLVREIANRARAEANLRDSEGRIRAVVDNVVDGIITIDNRGHIENFNPAAERIFGYLSGEVTGHNVNMLMPEPYHGEHDGYLGNYRRSGEAKIIGSIREVEGRRSDGSTFPMDLAVSEMFVGGKQMFTGIVRDITERKKVDRMKNEFISTVSHELRTPLTSIMGSLGLVRGGAAGDIPGQASSLLDIAHNNADRLVRLINDILDIEKIESGKMDFDPVSVKVAAIVKDAIEANLSYAEQYDVRLVTEDAADSQAWDAEVAGDPDRLAQVFANLISNAVKFSPKGGEVVLSAVGTGDGVRISIADRGSGIPAEFHERIFQKFSQADSSNMRAKGGTGLGLSICKAILGRLNGTIGFETEEGEGTTFYFELPLWQGDKKSTAAISDGAEDAAVTSLSILVCAGGGDSSVLLDALPARGGFEVDLARDVGEVRNLLAEKTYDALILDLEQAGAEGVALIRELRDNPKTWSLPVLALSAEMEKDSVELNGDAVSVVNWLEKPLDPSHLRDSLRSLAQSVDGDMPRILHVEDEPDVAQIVSTLLGDTARVVCAENLAAARKFLEIQSFDLVILDLTLPDGDGFSLLPELRHGDGSPIPVVVFSVTEVAKRDVGKFAATLVKSRTSNEKLVNTIKSIISRTVALKTGIPQEGVRQ